MKNRIKLITRITYALSVLFLLTGLLLTIVSAPVRAQEETPPVPEATEPVVETTQEAAPQEGLAPASIVPEGPSLGEGQRKDKDDDDPEEVDLCEWDKSSISIGTANCGSGDCTGSVSVQVCNGANSQAMTGPAMYWVLYNGNQIYSGTYQLGSGECTTLTYNLADNGNLPGTYKFIAFQRPNHPGGQNQTQGTDANGCPVWGVPAQCTVNCTTPQPTLDVTADRCVLSEGATGYNYTFTVTYSNFTSGDKFYSPNAVVIGTADADGNGSFTFTSSSASVTVTTDRGVSDSVTADQTLCPEPSIDVVGSCVLDKSGQSFLYYYLVSYHNLLVGTTVEYPGGSQPVTWDGDTSDGYFSFLIEENSATVTWSEDDSVSDTATVEEGCPLLDLQVSSELCVLDPTGAPFLVWTVYNPNLVDIDFTWEADPLSAGSGSETVPAGGTTTFKSDKLTTTSVTVYWGEGMGEEAEYSDEEVPIIDLRSVTAYPSEEIECPPDLQALLLVAPVCSLNLDDEWEMTWALTNPNPTPVEFLFSVNGGAAQGPYSIPAGVTMAVVKTPLGENTFTVYWNGGESSVSLTDTLRVANCEGTPYTPPDTPPLTFIPVTGAEPVFQAPAAGGEVLIPVTGADFSGEPTLAFWKKLSFNLGTLFLGIAMVLTGVRKKYWN